MGNYKLDIVANTPEELERKLIEAATILANLSDAINYFDEVHGSKAKTKKDYWKARADEWKEKYKVNE